MEQHPQLQCADCGASFVFSAAEAAVFAERGLSPPKRCKDCRRARKERASQDGQGGSGHEAGRWSGRGSPGAPRHGGAPRRYTGDVNEYRSPMADGFSPPPYGLPARVGGGRQGSGEYRSPMPDGLFRRGGDAPAARAIRADGNVRAGNGGAFPPPKPAGKRGGGPSPAVKRGVAPDPAVEPGVEAASKPRARRRPLEEMFSIHCSACGAQAEVPFQPAEGREVFCPTCYRARRPAPG